MREAIRQKRKAVQVIAKTLLSFSVELALVFAFLAPTQAHATEVCSQTPSAFERVDPGDDESGIGGTGLVPSSSGPLMARGGDDDESGIGGTGRAPHGGSDDESGIGGTGLFGTVLRVDRLCVNGFEVQVPDTLQIESALSGEGPQTLRVGQIVFIRALRTDSSLIAQRIQIHRSLEDAPWENGPPLDLLSIEGFVSAGSSGPRIGRLQLDFGFPELRPDAHDLLPGTRVRVIGHPEGGNILRIAPLRPTRPESKPEPGLPMHAPEPAPAPTRPERPASQQPPVRPERPEARPDWVRPERPALDERPQPRVIERPDIIDRIRRR